MNCPRCELALTERAINANKVRHCSNCDGLVVSVRVMNDVMKALVDQLIEQGKTIGDVEPCHQPNPVGGPCPDCANTMDNFRYLGKVHLDRCSPCMMLFIDGGQELEDTVRTWAISTKHKLQARENNLSDMEEMGRRMGLVIATQSSGLQ